MEDYRTEEEQIEALRRWWNENGRSIVAAVVIALAVGFGWQSWQANEVRQEEGASDLYQALLRTIGGQEASPTSQVGIELAEQLKNEFSSSTYAQFAALHLAASAVNDGNLQGAQEQLRWVLAKASSGSDTAQIAQLRLARVLAASGDTEQALDILDSSAGPYAASYAGARGDILLAAGRKSEARDAYSQALALAGQSGQNLNLPALQQKLQSLMSASESVGDASGSGLPDTVEAAPVSDDSVSTPEE